MLVLPPYSRLARVYDACLGVPSFLSTRRAFEKLVRRHGIAFGSAADLGCGTGLFACYLNARWRVPVFAVDRSAAMLREGRKNCPRCGVCFLQQDIRCLRLPRPVDLVTAHFDTLNHILRPAELRSVFERIFCSLRPGGHLLFDLVTDRLPWPRRAVFARRFPMRGGEVIQQVRWHAGRKMISIHVVQRWRGVPRPSVERHLERAYRVEDVGAWLRQAGFHLLAVLDTATLRPAHRRSARIAVVAGKPGRVPAGCA
jgi:SAM-dependent methyltransferase